MRRLLPILALLLPIAAVGTVLEFTEPSTYIDLTTPITDLAGHEVERSSGGTFEFLTSLPASGPVGGLTVQHQLADPPSAGTWCYRVSSFTMAGTRSGYSNTACEEVAPPDPPPPSVPAAPASLRVVR